MASPRIVIQAGHQNNEYSQPLNLGSGAPNEKSFNVDIANRVSEELRKRGFEVKQTDANAFKDPDIINQDWDMFLAIHYDADVYGTGGGFVDFPEPSTDGATQRSQEIARNLAQEYFNTTKIVAHPERSNRNTRYYYMWKYLSAKTPCVLIECGVGMHVEDDWKTLHFNRPVVIEGIVRGICKSFAIPYEIVQAPPQQPSELDTLKAENEGLKKDLETAQNLAKSIKTACDTKLAEVKQECQLQQESYKLQIKADLKKWVEAY